MPQKQKENKITFELLHLLESALNATANSILITNISGDIVWFNEAFLKMTGYSNNEVLYKNNRILNSGKHDKKFFQDLWDTILNENVWKGQLINKKKDGTLYYEEQTITPIKDSDGKIKYFVAIKEDISERIIAEEELHKSYIKYEELAYIVNKSPAIGFLLSALPGLPVEFISDNIRQFGYSPDEFYSGKLSFSSIIHPEDIGFFVDELINTKLSNSDGMHRIYRILTKQNYVRWMQDHTVIKHNEEGLISHFQGVIIDITDRKIAEEALQREREFLQTTLNNISDGILACNKEGSITLFNPAFSKITGIKSSASINNIFDTDSEILFLHNKKKLTKEDFSLFRALAGESLFEEEIEIIHKSNKPKFVILYSHTLRDNKGDIIGALTVMHDITESKKAEERAKLHQEQLIQAGKMVALGTLVSGVAHEINNPNNFIMLNVPMLQKTWSNLIPILEDHFTKNGDFQVGKNFKYSKIKESVPVLLEGIAEGSRRIKNIVQELKDFSRKETGDMDNIIDINEVVFAAVKLLNNLIEKSTKKFELDLDPNLPKTRGNFQQMEQVVINLLENSCQALENSSKGIKISSLHNDQENMIIIKIIDEGIGMEPSVLKDITNPFFTTKRDSGGTGLGLSVSSKIILNHKGMLEFKSEPGLGTTAIVSIPIT